MVIQEVNTALVRPSNWPHVRGISNICVNCHVLWICINARSTTKRLSYCPQASFSVSEIYIMSWREGGGGVGTKKATAKKWWSSTDLFLCSVYILHCLLHYLAFKTVEWLGEECHAFFPAFVARAPEPPYLSPGSGTTHPDVTGLWSIFPLSPGPWTPLPPLLVARALDRSSKAAAFTRAPNGPARAGADEAAAHFTDAKPPLPPPPSPWTCCSSFRYHKHHSQGNLKLQRVLNYIFREFTVERNSKTVTIFFKF